MKRVPYIPFCFLLVLLFPMLFSCGETAPTKEVRLIDSLNQQAYSYRYKNIDSAVQAAYSAYQQANHYKQGKAEASNNLGFCAFMQMDFNGAEEFFKQVVSLTPNELERLIADIGLMKVYQRTAKNKEYYDYRNSALRRMKRIKEDISIFVEKHEKERLNYAFSEFYIVSAIYYYYLQQRPEAIAAMRQIDVEETLVQDTAQYLYYQYVKGSAGLCESDSLAELVTCEFDNLFLCMQMSEKKGYLYFEANCLQGIAELLNERVSSDILYNRRARAVKLLNIEQCADSLLPYDLACRSLKMFREYNDIYQIAGTYRTIGTWLNRHGRYAEALDTLSRALDYVNKHHELYYHCLDSTDRLKPFIPMDTLYTELNWINQKDIKTVPEWIARIREQLSVAYAGLGMKAESDYNRNIYLDILYNIRQDKELESRYQSLEKESKELNALMFIVILGIILIIILFWILNIYWKRKNKEDIIRLRKTLDICQKITAAVPADATSADDIIDAVTTSVFPDFRELFHVLQMRIILPEETDEEVTGIQEEEEQPEGISSEFPLTVPNRQESIGVLELYTSIKLTKDEFALVNVITPYIAWTLENGLNFISLGDEERRLEKERYIYEQHIEENKRQNIVKKACLAIVMGINPLIDRIINEVHKLAGNKYADKEDIKRDKYQYMDELVAKINEYNDILALWIKMKQGSLSLNIENFSLNDLFDVLVKGRRTFEIKNQTFSVEPTESVVKADKALTLFMINTLTENARKYTPKGGMIRVYAKEEENYVEISVEDNGIGLTSEDVSHILNEKVYDFKQIGLNTKDESELKKNKGFGFGLMNCKGIIEKYRKTNDIFHVCTFNIESTPGKGSRFFFRLPKGIRKVFILLLLFSIGLASCNNVENRKMQLFSEGKDSVTLASEEEYERLLNDAAYYADMAYGCNVDGYYSQAITYIDSSMMCLNAHYQEYASSPQKYMSLYGMGTAAEIVWWKQMFDSDYHVVLDIRNEAAVAFLALKDWEAYNYNNEAYTALYKLVGEDTSLAEFCQRLQHSTNNKVVGIILCILLLLVILVGYYIFYIRRRFTNRRNLEQVLEINRQVFAASLIRMQEQDNMMWIPERIVTECFDTVNELLVVDAIGIAVYNIDTHKLGFAFSQHRSEEKDGAVYLMRRCFEKQEYASSEDGLCICIPLLADVGGTHQCVGVLSLMRQVGVAKESDRLLAELVARYLAIVIFNVVVKPASKYQDIELAQDETRRASFEDGLLHVQNMVLDNCLSTIKHETIYYPNRIKQIIDRLNSGVLSEDTEKENIEAIEELISYYKDIYTILSSCASRQLEEVTFRRGVIDLEGLLAHAQRYLKKVMKRSSCQLALEIEDTDLKVIGDVVQLKFLLECLIDEAVSFPADGVLRLEVRQDDGFVRFLFTDTRREKTVDELNQLFYPNLLRMEKGGDGGLVGTEYLVCKQIIREHDEYGGRRGCRINAEPSSEGGFTVYFTIPMR